jgi:hypothetical protein
LSDANDSQPAQTPPPLAPHVLFEITVGELQTNLSVIRIEIGDLVKNFERAFVVARTRVSIGDYEILCARVVDQSLTGVKLGEFEAMSGSRGRRRSIFLYIAIALRLNSCAL